MSIEPIGIATFLIGLFCLAVGNGVLVPAVALASLFGASAALLIGAANIQPGHVMLGFLLISVMSRRQDAANMLRTLRPGEPGFWFACLTLYGVVSAFLLPRVLAGTTQIVALGSSSYDETGSTIPLVPVSSNLTQSVYLTANLLIFTAAAGIAARREGFLAVLAGLMAYSIGNTFFAFLDLATYSTGTQDVLGFMRNARYTLHTETEVAGMKRIVGSFTEAAAFARTTLGVIGFTGTLWLCGYRPAVTGTLAATSLVLLVLSTSTAGLAGAPVILGVLFATALFGSRTVFGGRTRAFALVFAPPLLLAVLLFVLLNAEARSIVHEYLDMVILQKGHSDSGIERSSWNRIAFQNFIDTGGLGVGLGTARTSSFAVALIATVGIPGTLFYGLFFTGALLRRRGEPGSFPSCVRLAARNACFGLLIGDLLVCPVIEQGLFFCLLAALASAYPERDRTVVRAPMKSFVPLGLRA